MKMRIPKITIHKKGCLKFVNGIHIAELDYGSK